MYSLRLNSNDMRRLKKICRSVMMRDGLSYSDVSKQTGYSVRSLYNFFCNDKDGRDSRFIAAAVVDVLDIKVGAQK